MTQPNGFNIHLRYVKDIGKLYRRMDSLQPAVQTVMIDKDEHIPFVLDLAARYPQTLIVGRVRDVNDGGFHTEPVNDPQQRKYIASPNDFLNRWGALGQGKNLSLYTLNEPMCKEDMTDDEIKRLTDWYVETVNLAKGRGISLTGPNFGYGQPGLNRPVNDQWDARLDPLLYNLSANRDTMFLALHEYGPGEPHHLGRLLFMLARCHELKILAPKIVIPEFGLDSTTSPQNGYKARGLSGDAYVKQMSPVIKRIYMPLVEQGILLGWCFFSYGNSGGWDAFDVEDDEPFFDTLSYAIASGSMKPTKPIPPYFPPPEPPVVIEPPPAPVEPPPPAPEVPPEPALKKFIYTITVEATDEQMAQVATLSALALDALNKLAGASGPIKELLSHLSIQYQSPQEGQTV